MIGSAGVPSSGLSVQQLAVDGFDELNVVTRTPTLAVNAALPLSVLRNVTTTTGVATISETASPGEIQLQLTADGTASATLETRQCGSYTPGYQAEIGIGVRRPTAPVGNQVWRAGIFDGANGYVLRETVNGLELDIYSNGVVVQSAARSTWNVDKLDGTGPSSFTLDLTGGVIFEVDFTYYGYGAILWYFVLDDTARGQKKILVHRSSVSGVSVQNTNLPVFVDVANTGTATAFNLFVGGRQYSVVGPAFAEQRITAASRLQLAGIGTTYVPLVSFRPRVLTPRVQYAPIECDTIGDAEHLFSVWLEPTLTAAAWGAVPDVPTTDTLLECDRSATAMTGGIKIWEGLAAANTGQSRTVNSRQIFETGSRGIVTLAVRRVTGVNMTASGVMRVQESW